MSVIEASWIVVVLYQPSDDVIQFWLGMAKRHHLIVVDNSPDRAMEPDVLSQAKHVYHNHNNGGIAGALNYGLRWLSKAHPTQQWCFLFDQDSRPSWDFFAQMEQQCTDAAHPRLALCSPTYFETNLQKISDVIEIKHNRLVRHSFTQGTSSTPVNASYTITSGSLINLDAWQNIGDYDNGLFLDFVDIDWGLKAHHCGYEILVFPQIQLTHTLGGDPVSIGPWRFPAHSPSRHYLYFRNVCLMLRRPYVPMAWKQKELLKLLPRFLVYACATQHKLPHIKAMLSGLWHGCFYPHKNRLNLQ
jgi:rhamnosyltransferase